jgi:hypothetical protein
VHLRAVEIPANLPRARMYCGEQTSRRCPAFFEWPPDSVAARCYRRLAHPAPRLTCAALEHVAGFELPRHLQLATFARSAINRLVTSEQRLRRYPPAAC